MNKIINPEAFYDSLSIAHKLQNLLDGFKLEEIHLFSYFSSVLFRIKGNTSIEWSYQYIVDKKGFPFSNDINETNIRHCQNGYFDEKGEYYVMTGRGTDEYNRFKSLQSFMKREEYIDAACSTSILVPYTQTFRALLNDPEVKRIGQLDNKAILDPSNNSNSFRSISKALGVPPDDLIIPAVTWINYITKINEVGAK